MNQLVICNECNIGLPIYESEINRFTCDCGHTAPNSYGGDIHDAGRAWNDCNTETRTMADVMAENDELRNDITQTLIDSGEVMKHHTSLMAHIERLHYSLCEMLHAVAPSAEISIDAPETLERAKEVIMSTPLQSLNILEASAIRKVASILCSDGAGKNLVSHTALIKYAEKLENAK